MTQRTNGPAREVTTDTIREHGHNAAKDIRALAQQAQKEGAEVAAYAEEIAKAVTAAFEEVATTVADFMAKCQAARTSMKEHHSALMVTPPRAAPRNDEVEQQLMGAVQKAITHDRVDRD